MVLSGWFFTFSVAVVLRKALFSTIYANSKRRCLSIAPFAILRQRLCLASSDSNLASPRRGEVSRSDGVGKVAAPRPPLSHGACVRRAATAPPNGGGSQAARRGGTVCVCFLLHLNLFPLRCQFLIHLHQLRDAFGLGVEPAPEAVGLHDRLVV